MITECIFKPEISASLMMGLRLSEGWHESSRKLEKEITVDELENSQYSC